MAAAKKRTAGGISHDGAQAITHEDSRVNNPSADALDLVTEEVEQSRTATFARVGWLPAENRDRALDPQLVWTGKDEADRTELTTNAPAIFRQELVRPQLLMNELIAESRARKNQAEGTDGDAVALFAMDELPDANLDELDKVEWYQHSMNWTNRMILGDSLQVMASLVEREDLRGKVQMVYIDPPYGIKFNSNWQVTVDSRDVSDGKLTSATREIEQIRAFRDTWDKGIHSYLSYLRDRLTAARELLTESGSVFVQIGDENVHLVRSLLDEVFGYENFFTQITFAKTSSSTSSFGGTHDYVLWYAKDKSIMKFRKLYLDKITGGVGGSGYTRLRLPDGRVRPLSKAEAGDNSLLPDGARIFAGDNITSQSMGRTKGEGAASWFNVELDGRSFNPGPRARWKTNEAGMANLILAGRIAATSGDKLSYIRYLDDFPALELGSVWTDTLGQNQFGGDKVYVVQTALPVVSRCMLMCTDPGDLVLDPTCGSGTTAHVAEQWGRRWITVDTSRVALALARHRIMGAKYPAYYLADSDAGREKEAQLAKLPKPEARPRGKDGNETSPDIKKGFVYGRVPHITLKAIANNPEIKPGMSRTEIDTAIQKYAEYETLFDRPYEQPSALRVAGPFTMESLSPYKSMVGDDERPKSEQIAAELPENDNYVDLVLAHLQTTGVKSRLRDDRIEFDSIEPALGRTLTAVGIRKNADEGTNSRLGIALGPEYATVDQLFIKNAAREALAAKGVGMLLILGYAFDPTALEAVSDLKPEDASDFAEVVRQRTIGKMPVLLVRMNPELAMGNELKNTGAGSLFTVFGEPDVEVKDLGDGTFCMKILGIDTYNTKTGEVRSDSPDDIMLWTLDTDYNSEAFVVRHAYFSGKDGKPSGMDPYKQLKKALKADVDEEAWASLYRTESRAFPKPTTGKIAVKVVDRYGNEVLKVIEV